MDSVRPMKYQLQCIFASATESVSLIEVKGKIKKLSTSVLQSLTMYFRNGICLRTSITKVKHCQCPPGRAGSRCQLLISQEPIPSDVPPNPIMIALILISILFVICLIIGIKRFNIQQRRRSRFGHSTKYQSTLVKFYA